VLQRPGKAGAERRRGADGYFPSGVSADTGIGCWVFGSVTDKVLHSGDTPVLIVRPRENDKS